MRQASASASPSQDVEGASPSTSSATNAAPQGDKLTKQEADKKGKVASVSEGSNTHANSGARRLLSTPDNDDANAITVAPDENTAVSPRALHSEGPDNDDCIITGRPCHGLGDNVGDVIFNEEGAKGVVDDTPFTVAFEQPIASSSHQHGVTGACVCILQRTPSWALHFSSTCLGDWVCRGMLACVLHAMPSTIFGRPARWLLYVIPECVHVTH
jgi:hypothetical protein